MENPAENPAETVTYFKQGIIKGPGGENIRFTEKHTTRPMTDAEKLKYKDLPPPDPKLRALLAKPIFV